MIQATANPSKLFLSQEIFKAFDFLGIAPERFESLRAQYGDIYGLADEMAKRLGSK